MASSSSSALLASSSQSAMYTGPWDHDVFLCFRGDDTRHGFTSHLEAALKDKKIKVFIDTMLQKTESVDELLSVLKRSAVSVVIFSEKFADSSWCLNEVSTISQSMEKFGHRVLPVFYKVACSDASEHSGSYAATIDGKLKPSSEDNKRWRDALKSVAKCAGHTSEATPIESELLKAVVEDVQKLLIEMSPIVRSENLVGMGSSVWEVERLLAIDESDDTRIIGLWGMGGAGKTTLAKACYQRIVSSTKDIKHHFLRNINEKYEKQQGVDGIVHELYSKVLSESNLNREDLDMHHRRARLSRSKVFIVLDDVSTPRQLEELFLDVFKLTKLFAEGSRIIVTTRNKKVLDNAVAEVYEVACLGDSESIQLFSLRAFKKHCPPANWMHLSRSATSYCKGNPLALRVLGATLFSKNRDYWESFLGGLSHILKPDINDVLRRSYDKMGPDEKRLFLDVACFLHGISRSTVIGYLETLYPCAHVRVEDLIDKSLLTCVSRKDGEYIEVHDLLKELAWNIVKEEPKLGKRSRLMDPDDIHKLLATMKVESWATFFILKLFFKRIETLVLPRRKRRKVTNMHRKGNCALEGLRTTEGISLDLSKAEEMHLEANAFDGMDSLAFLKFYNYGRNEKKIQLPSGGLDSLPDGLRWLHWEGYPSKSLPFRFYPQHLVHLTIRDSPIKRLWEAFDQPILANLMVLNLSYCFNLTAVPDLSRSLKLEELLLYGCKSLVEIPSHVQYLDKLIKLDLGYCENLEHLPPKLNSKFLKYAWIDHCPKVKHCPEFNSGELMKLNLNGTPVKELPNAIYTVKELGHLHLCGKNLTNFPAISANLKQFCLCHTAVKEVNCYDHHHASSQLLPKFGMLNLHGNSQLKSLPKNIWNLVSSSLYISGSPLLESLPDISEPVNGLQHLSIIVCESLKSLPSSINNLLSLSGLTLNDTGIESLPSCIQDLDQLHELDLSNCKSLESIPSNVHQLPNLYKLQLRGCRSIVSLPELPPSLSVLDVGGCKLLQALPNNATKLSWKSLVFYDCPRLDKTVPNEILAKYPVYAPSSSRWSSERHYEIQYSGSEIPEWFAYKSMIENDGSCLTMQLPPANCTGSKQLMKGIAFGVVWSSDAFNDWPSMKCECNFGTITIASWNTFPFQSDGWDGTNSSDQVRVWLDKKLSGQTEEREEGEGEEEGEEWYVKYAGHSVSFSFYPVILYPKDVKRLKQFEIKRCGVSLLY